MEDIPERLFPIGRLDRNTTGILLLTNDGNFAQSLSHPKYEIQKEYTVMLNEHINAHDLEDIKKGITLEDGFIKVDRIITHKNPYKVTIIIHSGRYRIIRRIFEYFNYKVKALDRVRYAGLTKKNLPLGAWCHLTKREITLLTKHDI